MGQNLDPWSWLWRPRLARAHRQRILVEGLLGPLGPLRGHKSPKQRSKSDAVERHGLGPKPGGGRASWVLSEIPKNVILMRDLRQNRYRVVIRCVSPISDNKTYEKYPN